MKFDSTKHKFAVIQVEQRGYAVFGLGETPEAAKRDAIDWLDGCSTIDDVDTLLSPYDSHYGFYGGFKLSSDLAEIQQYVENL